MKTVRIIKIGDDFHLASPNQIHNTAEAPESLYNDYLKARELQNSYRVELLSFFPVKDKPLRVEKNHHDYDRITLEEGRVYRVNDDGTIKVISDDPTKGLDQIITDYERTWTDLKDK